MKIAIKIINWLTIILSIIMIILAIAFIIMLGSSINTEMGLWIFALFFAQLLPYSFSLIIPIIVCLISNHCLKKATCRKDVKVIGIITLILGNLISGILMLCLEDSDFEYHQRQKALS